MSRHGTQLRTTASGPRGFPHRRQSEFGNRVRDIRIPAVLDPGWDSRCTRPTHSPPSVRATRSEALRNDSDSPGGRGSNVRLSTVTACRAGHRSSQIRWTGTGSPAIPPTTLCPESGLGSRGDEKSALATVARSSFWMKSRFLVGWWRWATFRNGRTSWLLGSRLVRQLVEPEWRNRPGDTPGMISVLLN